MKTQLRKALLFCAALALLFGFKISTSAAKDAGYKKVTSISGKSKANTYTITKCGKHKLKSTTYYVKVVAKTKVGKKMKKSDLYVYTSSYVY